MASNRILAALTSEDLHQLQPRLTPIDLEQHDFLYHGGEPIQTVYFLESGLVSLINLSRSGDAVEVGIISAEGMVGGTALLDAHRSPSQATVQISGKALKMPTEAFLESCNAMPELRRLVSRHLLILLFEAQQNAACHALHTAEGRCCRWLLQARDVLRSNVIQLTQEFLANMVGARRTSVSLIAHTLQSAGLIRYRRGRIEITDEFGLEEAACECYSLIKREIDMQLPAGREPIS